MLNAKPLIQSWKCPYCGREYTKLDSAQACQGMCHLATLLDDVLNDKEWTANLPVGRFSEWKHADRWELARRLDFWARKYYLDNPNTTHA